MFKISESFSLPVSRQIQKLIRAFAANFQHKMLTMFQLCQVMVMISFSSSITLLASDQLHPGEVEALRQIGKTVNEDGQLSLKFVDSCRPNGLVKTELTSAPPNLEGNSTIECNCSITDDNYCHITSFQLKDYSLPGRLPQELANLTYVQKIDFTRNYLYGTIPVEWASMKNLSFISLTANRLSGNIPGHLGSFTALTYLSLESNQFSGVVPPELGKLVNLKTLILSGNKLVGTLPEALAQIKDLKDFRVSDNNLNGTVPEFIGNWTQLQKLDLYATGLQGPIPLAIFHLEKLSDLRIADMPGPEFQLPNSPIERQFLYVNCFITFHSKVEDMFYSELFNQPVTCCKGSEEHQFNWNNSRKRMESGKNTVSVNFTHRLTSAAKQIRISA